LRIVTRKRSRLEIYLDVLHVVKSGAQKPTHIMYKANLSNKPLQEILRSLVNQGLIILVEDERSSRRHQITDRGALALGYFMKTKELLTIKLGEGYSNKPLAQLE